MPTLQIPDGSLISYEVSGDGFPLVLLPGPDRTAPWLPHIPLLGELCRTIAYEGCRPKPAKECLTALLDSLELERVYLASPVPNWLPALEFAGLRSDVVEALFLVEFPGTEGAAPLPGPDMRAALPGVTLPTFFLLADDSGSARKAADCLSACLPHCGIDNLGRFAQGRSDLPNAPQRQFPHLMMKYLLDRERHRNLVQGASFLL